MFCKWARDWLLAGLTKSAQHFGHGLAERPFGYGLTEMLG